MKIRSNPFTLTYGKIPPEYVTRYDNIEYISGTFCSEIPQSQAFIIEGVRGSGKTVLMTSVAKELQSKGDWAVVNLNASDDFLDSLASRLRSMRKRIRQIFDDGINLSVAGFGIGLNGAQDEDSVETIEEFLAALAKKKKKLLVTIDEVRNGDNIRRFASQFQIFLREDYPIFLLLTGLYEHIYAIQNDPILTFLLRTPKIRMEPLGVSRIFRHYKKVFDVDEEQAMRLAEETKGYAFAFQALGLLYFDYGGKLSMEEILDMLDDRLDDGAYRKIWDGLSGQERRIVSTVSEGVEKTADIRTSLSMSSSTFSKYRDVLIKKGVLHASGHGRVELALPRFASVSSQYEGGKAQRQL